MFAALADATRRAILELLAERERTVSEIADAFPRLYQPTISHHLRTLRDAGLADVRREKSFRIYSLRREGLDGVEAWLDRCRAAAEA